ncbi:DUF2437 domain-containing protein [Paenibacillus thalictri]|uniref:DUF2437 domain-containing protein n=2 Tax=Paenibacillus thalictri TaxID=2527873 RepID=A0A4Q9DSZ3_9BACL|nr:fumarylacetoacetate hydrolase family protein [Paenibacillus thalictri]TBL80024.1 DUF2437 domain-containing protein [Paenibacillus thalictri]
MKFARFKHNLTGTEAAAFVTEEGLHVIQGDIFGSWTEAGAIFPFSEVTLLPPLRPNSIIGIGANYIAAGQTRPARLPEIPLFFHKPISSLNGPNDEILIPRGLDKLNFECELAVVIGKQGKYIPVEKAQEHIFGYTIANDVSAVQLTHPGGHWMLVKSGDTFTPLGPYIETELDPYRLTIQSKLNSELKQNSPTERIIYPIAGIISYLSQLLTLQPGDVILTGTPEGAGEMRAGDTIECSIAGIGSLSNRVIQSLS